MGISDNRIAVARKIPEPRDTDEELPPMSGQHDTWPPSEEPTSSNGTPLPMDTIPTPPPSSGVVEHITIPSMPAVHIDE
jgi:hypothetical protein